uniref:Monooxygenase DBH-like protein n=1 Tax=Ampulex compressa TaxID=860918 RepID=A0A1W6EVR1_AMPCP|nr:monooxygenase DBH-like protein [Ampulex compressa]
MASKTCSTLALAVLLLSLIAISFDEAFGHVALTFPKARKYDLDFLDNRRTPGPCGMPRGDIKTSLLSGSNFNVTWHLAYPHRGGFRLQILDALDRPLVDLTPVTQNSEFVAGDATAQSYAVQLPQNFTCTDCTIRLLREAEEWAASYRFWSCADVDIVERKAYREDCSGHGRYLGRCRCDRLYHGTRCEFKEECLDDSDCGIQGTCIDNGGTTAPTKLCYCNTGWFGHGCAKRSPVRNFNVDLDSYTMKRFSDDFTFYWRILKESKELEGIMVVNSTTWVAVGWRPDNLTPACRAFPEIADRPKDEPLPQPEPKSEPESRAEAEPKAEPKPEPEAIVEPEAESERSGAKRRSASTTLVSTIRPDADVTVQTSVTYRVSAKQGRKKRSPEETVFPTNASLPAPVHKYTPKHDFNPMDCTDIIIGTARGTSHRIGDYYTRDRSTPRRDDYWGGRDSLTAAMGFEKDGVTTIVFRRKLAANEPSDHEIGDANMQVIWAKGQEPGKYVHSPPSGIEKAKVGVKDFYKVDELKYHGHRSQRGVATLNFFEEAKKQQSTGSTILQSGGCGGQWQYPRHCSPENDTCEYFIRWTYKARKDQINFVIRTTNTKTWTGVGFSRDEKMTQTDAVLGLVDEGGNRAFVMDTWISGYNAPLLDPSQDIFNTSCRIENGVTTLKFSRKRQTKDSRDLSFTDDECLYMMFPVKGGAFNAVNKKIQKHNAVPIVSAEKICIRSCGIEEEEEQSTVAPPRWHYDVEVKLVNLGDGFVAPEEGTPDFEVISNTISDSFGPIFEKLPGYHEVRLTELKRDEKQNGAIARMNLVLDKYEAKGRSLRPLDTNAAAEKALREALMTGKVGALSVDPQYMMIKPPRVNEVDGAEEDDDYTFGSDLFLGPTKLYIVIGCVAALLALAFLQASCTLYRSSRRRATKGRLIPSNAWKDYSSGANTNLGFEAFETEEKAPPPPVSSLPRHREMIGNGTGLGGGTDAVEGPTRMVGPRATYSLPRAPGARHSAPIQPGYYTQDRRDHYQRSKSIQNPAGSVSAQPNQPDFYFMPSQRKYSGEVVRVYVDYGSQMPK